MGDRREMENSPGFDADDLGLCEQLAHVTHGQAVEQVHQDDDGDENKEDEEGEVEEGERVAAVNGQVRELKLADEHGESLEDARPWLVKVIHPVLVFRVVTNKALQEFNPDSISFILHFQSGFVLTLHEKKLIGNLMEQDEEAEGEGNKENGKEGEDGEEGQQHL